MEHFKDSAQLLDNLTCPAFVVKEGVIVNVNQSAAQHNIKCDTTYTGLEAYLLSVQETVFRTPSSGQVP